jgi:DNA primase
MAIKDIKEQLTIEEVLHHYGLQPDKHQRLSCPFHEDTTPSMQVYLKTNTAYCFSSNCTTHGRSLDVIDFIMHMERSNKHEAIKKAESLLSGNVTVVQELTRTEVLTKMFSYFKNAVASSKPAQEYIKSRNLNPTKIEIGYNTAQFHHGARKDESLIQSCVEVGLLTPWGVNSRAGGQAYKPFAKECICFALRNKVNQITGLYFRSTTNNSDQRHFYLKDRSGLYPHYPKPDTKKLILTESIIDAATLLQNEEIIKQYSILSLYGTNGLTAEHQEAIRECKELDEVIFFLNGDEPGRKATEKHGETLRIIKLPHRSAGIKISKVNVPENEDVNSLGKGHEAGIFSHLLKERVQLFFSGPVPDLIRDEEPIEKGTSRLEGREENITSESIANTPHELNSRNPYKLQYRTATADYCILGGISKMADSMKVTLQVQHLESSRKSRNKLDLYEDKQVEKLCREVSEKLNVRKDLLEADLYKLTDLLDEYREKELLNSKPEEEEQTIVPLTIEERKTLDNFLKQPDLIKRLNELLGKAGITGEEQSRIFLLLIAISYKMPDPLHALIQGSSGSGKTRLLKQISDCMPGEKVTRLTRISDKVLYNYPEKYFINRLLCLEDIDGLSEEAEFAFRELQSNGELNSAASIKLENGQITSGQKTVKGPIASLACTTKGEIYEDNMSRCFLVAVDESESQTRRVIQYQNERAAGETDAKKEQEVKRFIQNLVRQLSPLQVINPYANKVHLPQEAHKIRRLNEMLQSFVKMVTIINQYQRKKDDRGRLVAEIQDLEEAIEIMFESIVLKVDELDGSLRQFYEKLKDHLKQSYNGKHKEVEFSLRDIRQALALSKTQLFRYAGDLLSMEYLSQSGGYANRGFKYRIAYWDNYQVLRDKIKNHLQSQLETLKSKKLEHPGTPVEHQNP